MNNPLALLPMLLIFVLFYFMLIRPQMAQQKKRTEFLSSLKEGDHIRTICGIYGTIEKINADILTVRIADNVKIKLARFGAERVVEKE